MRSASPFRPDRSSHVVKIAAPLRVLPGEVEERGGKQQSLRIATNGGVATALSSMLRLLCHCGCAHVFAHIDGKEQRREPSATLQPDTQLEAIVELRFAN